MDVLYVSIACGILAVLYGWFTRSSILAASAGNEKMQKSLGLFRLALRHT